ncbi:DNA-binding protein [Chitinophaga sancti]|uniref:DNA-binding protein n=2 Tax=Chitinophaga sancti TaxID=1004 RepID=A0ABZ0XEW9_9BACT|nr:hypothetical protein [Chitinophaga sancti]WQD65351.1 DNA-binding protein [Chitinophaga sancti]WQG89025.1 DNA-binding protein [Chitinophaga sancti]
MENVITQNDLKMFRLQLLNDIRQIVDEKLSAMSAPIVNDWIKAGTARKILDMSPGSLQNLSIAGRIRFKKIRGSYYYNLKDINNLFK